jgi:hypothetical protein
LARKVGALSVVDAVVVADASKVRVGANEDVRVDLSCVRGGNSLNLRAKRESLSFKMNNHDVGKATYYRCSCSLGDEQGRKYGEGAELELHNVKGCTDTEV